jgi:hypothetical protein
LLYLQIRLLHDEVFFGKLKTGKYPAKTSHATWKSTTVNKSPSLGPTLCQIKTNYMLFIYLYAKFLHFSPTYRYQVSIDTMKAAKVPAFQS